jgi:hypothetical protein
MANRRDDRDEIVEEIVDHLRPWKGRKDNAAITTEVNRELDLLLEWPPQATLRSYQKEERTHARRLHSALTEVETLLSSARGWLSHYLFYPFLPSLHLSYWEWERTHRERYASFAAELRRLRSVCAHAVNPGFDHPNYDPLKHFCAKSAHGLMQAMSDKRITSSKDGAFRTIAGLLYKAVRGKRADLKRACDSVLRESRRPQS